MKILSIVIPHYNNFSGLIRLIDSLPIIDDIEIIVVDDDSTMDVPDKFHEYLNSKKVYFYVNQEKNSAGTCRNIGKGYSKGKYITFIDSDDFVTKSSFVEMVKSLYNLDYDLIYYPVFSENEFGLSPNKRGERTNNYIFNYIKKMSVKNETILRTRLHRPAGKVFKLEFINNNNIMFDDTMYSNDVMFSLKTGIKANKILALKLKFYVYTNRKGSLTQTINDNSIRIRDEVYNNFVIYLNKIKNSNKKYKIKYIGLGYLKRSFSKHRSIKKIFKKDLPFLRKNKISLF